MDNTAFLRLENIPQPDLRDGFFLNTSMLEKEMQKLSGIDITGTQFNIDEKYLRQHVPFFEELDTSRIKKLTDKYQNITGPCSMIIESLDELTTVMTKAYEISYYHYALGKKHNLKGSFPDQCCVRSSKNVVLSLYEAGFPNAAHVRSQVDHAYLILPFVFEKENIKGSIIVDPTYDQLQFDKKVRNAVFIKIGTDWEYKEANTERDLSPNIICALDSVKKSQLESIDGHYYKEEFFEKAFNNKIKINYNRN